jgi:hypothetical protein
MQFTYNIILSLFPSPAEEEAFLAMDEAVMKVLKKMRE